MPLSEADALAIRDTFDTLPDDAKPLASDWLKRYKEQQDEFGLPLFPSDIAKADEEQRQFFGMFEDLKSVDAGNGIYDQAERLEAGGGDKLRQREASMRFLARQFPDVAPNVVRRDFPLYRDDFAMKAGGKRDMGDGEFYAFAKEQVMKQREAQDLRTRSLDAGFRSAIENAGSLEAFAKVASTAGNADKTEVDPSAFLESYSVATATLNKHRGLVREIMSGIKSSMDGGDVDLEPLKEKLLDLPGTERRMVLASLRMQAEKAGEGVKGEKGGKMSLTAGKFFQQVGESAGRLIGSASIDAANAERIIESIPDAGEVMAKGEIKTPEDARRYVRDAVARETSFLLSSTMAGPGGVGAAPVEDRQSFKLGDEAKGWIQDAKEREKKRLRLNNEIRTIGEAADPIPNVFASTIGTSGAALLLMAGTRGLAAPALAQAYSNIEYNDLSLKYPTMSRTDKAQIAGLSGAAQSALDFVGVKALDKLPGIKSLISQPLTKQLAGRALARGASSYAAENAVEAAQDIATPALMAALKSDVPGFDWDAEMRDFWKGRADVAVGLLPLVLLGVGAASVNEYRGAKELLTWNDKMAAAGIQEQDRIDVIEEAQSGSLAKAQSLFMAAFKRRDPAIAAEYQEKLSDNEQDLAAAREELTRLGMIPDIYRDRDGYTVRNGETSAFFKTWDEARAVATESMNDTERAQVELVATMADSFIASTPGYLAGETINIRQRGESLVDRVSAGEMTPENAMEAAVAGGVLRGVTIPEARAIAAEVFGGETKNERALKFREEVEKIVVLGRNVVENGVSKSTANLRDNERAFLTVVEEVVEGRWKGGLQRGKFTKEQGVNWVKLAEAATGETFLEGATWEDIAASAEGSPRALTEAISRIITADVFGRMADGKRVGPGLISRGLNLNDREQSALASILKAFQQLFKALLHAANKLAQARSEGKLGEEYDTLFNELTGGSSQLEHEAGALQEAASLIDTSGYSEATPGPNGETFSTSRAIPADASKVETFSLRSGDFEARAAAMFSPFQRTPELRMAITRVAKERAMRFGADWIEKTAILRTSASISKEQAFREADSFDRRVNDYLDSLTPAARQTLEFEPSALENDPLVAAMLDFGKLMSQSTAKKLGKVEAKSGDYDGAPWLPPAWYSKGAGIMPDQMAQAMHDAGLLPDAYTGTLWDALASRIESTRKDKAAHREAVQAYQDAKKQAKADAKAEAEAWASQTKKEAGSPKAQREMLKAALRTLDGILSAAPPEVRAKVGGYVKLAGLATDEAMLAEIERRVAKLNVELEKWLKKEAVTAIAKLLKKGRPDSESGKKAKGKDADMHALFAAAEAAIGMNALQVAGRLADLDARIGSGELSHEQEVLAITERGVVELVGDLDNADSGRAWSALETLQDIYRGGWLKWKLAQIERRENRAGLRQALISDTGKKGIKPERDEADKFAATMLGKIKGGFLSLSSFHEVLSYAFGSKSERVTSLVDAEREASGQYEDASQNLADEVEALFSSLAGGSVLKGERLRYDMAQRTIETPKGNLSQLEAIQALLMWKQEDGQRHMEGTRNEAGEITSSWSYDQAWIDDIEAALTPEARRVMGWIVGKYSAEWQTLNPLYRERYGVNLPHHDNYAPLTVVPMQTKAGEVVDPVSGAAMSSGSILTPGSLRTRSRSAIAEPEFRDALQTLLIHSRQMEYWKAYFDLATEANAVLGNRNVLNAVRAKGGEESATALRKWVDALAQGGFRDASASLGMSKLLSKMTSRAASVGLLGRFSTLLVQSTQLAAASVKMPLGAYLRGMSRLLTGRLGYGEAIKSEFIQRRFRSAPPIVRQALENLGSASKPNQITRATRALGQLLSGTDALFTAGTYTLLLDYHRGTGRALGLTGAELEEHAHREAERATEQVAQPTRMATRSLAELTSTNPLAKVSWAYASEARQKVALMAWATYKAKSEPAQFAKTAFLVFGVGGLMTQIIKNLWREAKGDDDESKWDPTRLTIRAMAGPLHGVPLVSELAGDGGMLSGVQWAWPAVQDIASGEGDMRDIDTLLSVLGLFNDTAAGISSLSHAGLDAAKVIENLASDD